MSFTLSSLLRPPAVAADSSALPRWKYFWLLLAAGLALRLLLAVGGDWSLRPDELMQYLEQAHRLVFGYGFVPWEFRFGVRTWLIPAIPAVPLFFTKIFNLDSPDIYIPLVNSWNALLSMAIPAGMYFYTRRTAGELAARWALVLGCFWHEFLLFAPHALAESYAAALFMAALAIGYGERASWRLVTGGFLLGLVFAVRVPYAPLVAIYGISWLAVLPRRLWVFPLAGGAGGLLLWGGVDYLTWGGWWASIINYYDMSKIWGYALESKPFYLNMLTILTTSAGLYAVIVVCAFAAWRRHPPLILMTGVVAALNANPLNQEYTNIFIIFPLLWMLAAIVMDKWARGRAIKILTAAAIVVSFFGLFNKLPFVDANIYKTTESLIRYQNAGYRQTRLIDKAIGDELNDAIVGGVAPPILWTTVGNSIIMGGYYHLHRKVPIYFFGDARHIKSFDDSGLPQHKVFSYIVTQESRVPQHYTPQLTLPGLFIYRNNAAAQVTPLPDYVFDSFDGFFINMILGKSEDTGILLPETTLTPFYEQTP